MINTISSAAATWAHHSLGWLFQENRCTFKLLAPWTNQSVGPITLAGLSTVFVNEHSDPIGRCAHPVCSQGPPRFPRTKGHCLMFGFGPAQADPVALSKQQCHDRTVQSQIPGNLNVLLTSSASLLQLRLKAKPLQTVPASPHPCAT